MVVKNVLIDYIYTMKEIHINPYINSKHFLVRLYGNHLKKKIKKKINSIDIENIADLDYKFINSFIELISELNSNKQIANYYYTDDSNYCLIQNEIYSFTASNSKFVETRFHTHFKLLRINVIKRKKTIEIKADKNAEYKITKRFIKNVSVDCVDGVNDNDTVDIIKILYIFIKQKLLEYIDS